VKLLSASSKHSGTLSVSVRRALREAADRAAARMARETGRTLAEAGATLRQLAEAVSNAADGRAPSNALAAPGATIRDYVDALRSEFVQSLASSRPRRVNGAELLAVLAALEALATSHAGAPASTHAAVRAKTASSEAEAHEPTTPGEFVEALAQSEALNGMLEIAHDMRSPLSAILLLVEPIRRGQQGPVTPSQERQLGIIYGAALSLSTLANDIIEAARGTRRTQSPLRPFSISGIIQDACAVVRPIAEEKQLELLHTFPAVDGRVGDAAAIHRVLLNLASNALKYTERGSVAVGCNDLDDTRVEFWVQDTGTGIPSHVLTMLYEGFRPGPAGFQFSSSGLGLAICRSLLEGMGSALQVDTSPEHGTRFSFVLELQRAASPTSP
jgi:signal transduction histidine kinase